jgi:hypothetical protein
MKVATGRTIFEKSSSLTHYVFLQTVGYKELELVDCAVGLLELETFEQY